MSHPVERKGAAILTALRERTFEARAENSAHLTPGFYLNWDEEEGDMQLDLQSRPGDILDIAARASGAPRWMSLNIELGHVPIEAGDILGVVADLEGDAGTALEMFVRSGTEDGLRDTILNDRLTGLDRRRPQAALHRVEPDDGVVGDTRFHTLVISLPRQDFTLTLHDLRCIALPAGQNLMLAPATLSEAAAISP